MTFNLWKGAVFSPEKTFASIKKVSINDAVPHYVVSLIPAILVAFIALFAGSVLGFIGQLVFAAITLVVGIAICYGIAKLLGGKGTLEKHVYGQGINAAAYTIFGVGLFVILGILGLLLVGPALLSMNGANPDWMALIGKLIAGGIILVLLLVLFAIAFVILALRSAYYFFKGVHGFGLGKFVLALILNVVASFIIGLIIGGFSALMI